jgi:GNAT superfamily N-acetyltransferase
MPNVTLSSYREADASGVNDELALAAFEQFRSHYSDWPTMASGIARMSALADAGEIIVAERDKRIIGIVAYIGPGRPKAAFDQSWPIIRMLVVDPLCRGGGVGRALTEECTKRARRDGSPVIALHTSPIMAIALPMYLRMGFQLAHSAPPIHGVPYAAYLKNLAD